MTTIRLYFVNAFVDPSTPHALNAGNPAAVALLTPAQSASLSDAALQSLATELNLSDTAYVTPTDTPSTFHVRWFTPVVEVALCGHATLAAAAAILEEGWVQRGDTIKFETRKSGRLTVCTKTALPGEPPLRMQFPLLAHREELAPAEMADVTAALRLKGGATRAFRSDYDVIVLLDGEQEVRDVTPDMARVNEVQARGVIVAARSADGGFVSRFFAPGLGIPEDPVCGSAHCALAGVFLKVGDATVARQLSERGGVVCVGRPKRDVVELGGWVRVVVKGEVQA